VLAAAGIDRAVVVGHSDGAVITLFHAASQAANTVAAAVLAPHSFVEQATLASIRTAREAYLAGPLRDRLLRHHGDNVDTAFWGWNGAWLDPGFVALDLRPRLAAIEIPLLVIQGEDDEYGTIAQVEAITRALPAARALMLSDCAHSPHRDQPRAVLEAIRDFVAGLDPG